MIAMSREMDKPAILHEQPDFSLVSFEKGSNMRFLAPALALAVSNIAVAQSDQDLAKQLANPIAALISVPLQLNYDEKIGATRDGSRLTLNVQPVVPMTLNAEWNVISRTIVPITSQKDIAPGSGQQSGLGDVVQSLFFSPKAPTAGGLIWGAGPVALLPTGSDDKLSARKWGLGPTVVLLKQDSGYTYGFLGNHIWGVSGDSTRQNVSATFLQPFLSYTTKDAWTYGANLESTYDWKASKWSVPINLTLTKLTSFGKQPVSIGAGVRYWATSPDSAPHDLGLRLIMTFLFPK